MTRFWALVCLCFLASASSPAGAQTTTSGRWHNIRFADEFTGTDSASQINAAIADCGAYSPSPGASCIVVVPSGMACGEPNSMPDNVILWDLRGCTQSLGLRFNLSSTATGHVRSKLYLEDNYNALNVGLSPTKASATLYTTAFVDSPEATSGSLAAINGSMFVNRMNGDMTSGHVIGIEGEAVAVIPGTTNRSLSDMRGGTFNTLIGQSVTATNVTSLYAQAPAIATGGKILNAYSFRAEAPTVGTAKNLAGWFNGDVQVDTTLRTGALVIGAGTPVHEVRIGGAALSFGSIAARTCRDSSISVPGADQGSAASASPSGDIGAGLTWSAWVPAAGSVTVRVCNLNASTATPSALNWKVQVVR